MSCSFTSLFESGTTFRVHTSSLYSPKWKVDETLGNIKAGKLSMSRGEVITVSKIGRGKYYILNGNHRVVEDILAGKTTVDVKLDQYTPDMNKTGGAYNDMMADAVPVVDHVSGRHITERTDLDAVKRVQPELDTIISGVQDFFRSCSKAFELTDVNDPFILDCLNKLMWNGIEIGEWTIRWTPAKYVQKGAAASVITDSKAIDLHCLRTGTRRLYLLLEKYRMNIGTVHVPPGYPQPSASWVDSANQVVAKVRAEAATSIKGLVAKVANPSLKFFLAHEIHHVDDYKHPWFSKSKMSMMGSQMKAHSKAEKEIRSSGNTRWSLAGKFRTRDITKPQDYADVVNRRADSLRHDAYNASSHEYNANVRAALPIALKQKTFSKALEAFKKAYISFNQIPPKLQRKAISRLYQAWAETHGKVNESVGGESANDFYKRLAGFDYGGKTVKEAVAYHVTLESNLPSVLRNGLVPSTPRVGEPLAVYLTPLKHKAKSMARQLTMSKRRGNYAVLQVDTSGLELFCDPKAVSEQGFYCLNKIDPSRVRHIETISVKDLSSQKAWSKYRNSDAFWENKVSENSFIQLFEGGIEGTKITPDESIKACGVRNRKTGEVIEDDFHYEAWETAWRRGWLKDIGERYPYFQDATLKEILDIQPGERGTPGAKTDR